MPLFKVGAIKDMIERYPRLNELYNVNLDDVQIIVITTNKYQYNFKPLLELDFDDITKQDSGKYKFISQQHIEKIIKKLPEIKKAYLLFICCDAGISRSPAVASALAHYLGDAEAYGNLTYRYPFANHDVFTELLLGLKTHTKNLNIS